MLGFLGMTDVEFIGVEGVGLGLEPDGDILGRAENRLDLLTDPALAAWPLRHADGYRPVLRWSMLLRKYRAASVDLRDPPVLCALMEFHRVEWRYIAPGKPMQNG